MDYETAMCMAAELTDTNGIQAQQRRRDDNARAYMQGYLAHYGEEMSNRDEISKEAYRMADAMERAREGK